MRIGIAGNGKIVSEMIEATKEAGKIFITAICARAKSKDKAQALADKYNIAKVYTDYQAMLNDDEIDFIYVAVANSVHYQYAKEALQAGKNVICEKPFTVTATQTAELIELAKAKHLFLCEAITLIHSPNFAYIKENLAQIGKLHYIHANYAQYSSRYDRYLKQDVAPAFDPKAAGGALYDLNIYNLHFILGLFGEPVDKNIVYRANLGFNGIDTSGTALLNYDGFTAVCSAAKDSESISGIIFQGEKGYIELVGAPNEAALIREHIKGKPIKLVSKERHNHRMVDEFVDFIKMYEEQDYTACYAQLEHSLLVMNYLEKARLDGKIKFEV